MLRLLLVLECVLVYKHVKVYVQQGVLHELIEFGTCAISCSLFGLLGHVGMCQLCVCGLSGLRSLMYLQAT